MGIDCFSLSSNSCSVWPIPPIFTLCNGASAAFLQGSNFLALLVLVQSEFWRPYYALTRVLEIEEMAQDRYFEDEAFIGYLKCLQYWHWPESIKFIT